MRWKKESGGIYQLDSLKEIRESYCSIFLGIDEYALVFPQKYADFGEELQPCFPYKSKYREQQVQGFFPRLKDTFVTDRKESVFLFEKEPDQIFLNDLFLYEQEMQEIPDRYKVWAMTQLMQLAMHFHSMQVCSLCFCKDSFLWNVGEDMKLSILNGQEFSHFYGTPYRSLPKKLFDQFPRSVLGTTVQADPEIDRLFLLELGKQFFHICEDSDLQKFFIDAMQSEDSIYELYGKWDLLVKTKFGSLNCHGFEISYNDIY